MKNAHEILQCCGSGNHFNPDPDPDPDQEPEVTKLEKIPIK